MRVLSTVGAILAVFGSIFVFRIVLHGYTDHGYLDVFHLVVGVSTALLGMYFGRLAFLTRGP